MATIGSIHAEQKRRNEIDRRVHACGATLYAAVTAGVEACGYDLDQFSRKLRPDVVRLLIAEVQRVARELETERARAAFQGERL